MSAKTLPGADCSPDHQMLVNKIKLQLKKRSKTKRQVRLNMQEITENYTTEVKNRFSSLEIEERTLDEIWQEMKEIILEAKKSVPKNRKRQKTKWITAKTIRIAKVPERC